MKCNQDLEVLLILVYLENIDRSTRTHFEGSHLRINESKKIDVWMQQNTRIQAFVDERVTLLTKNLSKYSTNCSLKTIIPRKNHSPSSVINSTSGIVLLDVPVMSERKFLNRWFDFFHSSIFSHCQGTMIEERVVLWILKSIEFCPQANLLMQKYA